MLQKFARLEEMPGKPYKATLEGLLHGETLPSEKPLHPSVVRTQEIPLGEIDTGPNNPLFADFGSRDEGDNT
jgi:hypothetical protein